MMRTRKRERVKEHIRGKMDTYSGYIRLICSIECRLECVRVKHKKIQANNKFYMGSRFFVDMRLTCVVYKIGG